MKKTNFSSTKNYNTLSYPTLFILCGIIGWCLEVTYTALKSLQERKFTLMGYTSLWMFPIYGSAAFLKPLFKKLQHRHFITRGIIYALFIFLGEFISGTMLDKIGCCPWSYERNYYRIGKCIRLDFLPNWFLVGLLYEKLVLHVFPKIFIFHRERK